MLCKSNKTQIIPWKTAKPQSKYSDQNNSSTNHVTQGELRRPISNVTPATSANQRPPSRRRRPISAGHLHRQPGLSSWTKTQAQTPNLLQISTLFNPFTMDLRAVLATVLCLSAGVIGTVPEEQCHTFAGGAVYPNTEGRASGHSLQWTKAMSKYFFLVLCVNLQSLP